MRFTTEAAALDYIFKTHRRLQGKVRGLDENTRDTTPTQQLLTATRLLDKKREYAVVTGSKGKGSVTAITAKLLHSLGHTTGMMTSPHLVTWYERIRINGKVIPQDDFLRILSDLAPFIDDEIDRLTDTQYISPQGIFLLMALQWFNENEVDAAVLEVGRGGRFDDIALVPNMVSLFTPIVLEHAQYLGATTDRIAWHKAGIIKPASYVYSVAQAPEVLEVIQREADAKESEFFWFSSQDTAEIVQDTSQGMRIHLQRYGDIEVPFLGHYQAENITLAVQAAGNIHGRLKGISHGSPEYIERIRGGLEQAQWFGRLQKLQATPAVYVDGAVNPKSAHILLESLESRLTRPLVIIAGVPRDRDYPAVYQLLAAKADSLILTETDIHPNIHFPDADHALHTARQFHADVAHRKTLPEALTLAYEKAGSTGTIILAVAQPLVGEAMLIWKIDTSEV